MAPTSRSTSRRAAVGSFIGAVVEWYDFLLYGIVAAIVFGSAYFPESSDRAGTLAAFATFGVGFCFRPLGGVIFGHFGDKLGRKRMLLWTLTTMGVATALIGLLPTYDSIGWYAPLLLVVLRAIQGIAVGGEWGGAALMAVENAPRRYRALYASGVQVGYSVALLLVTAFVAILQAQLSEEAFDSWGWRVPFLFSAVLVMLGIWIRAGVSESPVFQREVAAKKASLRRPPVVEAVRQHPRAFGQIFALRLAELFSMYIVTAFAISYGTKELGFSEGFMLSIGLIVGGVGIVTIPFFAWLSDVYGRRRVYLGGAAVGALTSIPFFLAMESGSTVLVLVCAILLINIAHDAVVSVQQPLFTELFGAEHRYSGAGVGYQVASAIAGGFTPFIATGLVALNGGRWYLVGCYLLLGCLASFAVAYFMRNSDHEPALTTPKRATAGEHG